MPSPIAFFVGGVQKGGTTSLHGYLSQHPQLSAPLPKELHVFDDETRDWQDPNFTDLDAHYSAETNANDRCALRFDATPIYSFWPPSLARIQVYNPAAKLIFLFREPFARAWSHWCMEYARGADSLPFALAIRQGRDRMAELPELADERRVFSYVERGYYGAQVACARKLFPPEQLLFMKSDDLARDHAGVLARVAAFLHVAPFPDIAARNEHRQPAMRYPSQPTDADRDLVRSELASDMAMFTELTGICF